MTSGGCLLHRGHSIGAKNNTERTCVRLLLFPRRLATPLLTLGL
jgi:hypothetical protein